MAVVSDDVSAERAALMPLLAELRKVVADGRAVFDRAEQIVERAEEAEGNG